jgi:hypothetical protein
MDAGLMFANGNLKDLFVQFVGLTEELSDVESAGIARIVQVFVA